MTFRATNLLQFAFGHSINSVGQQLSSCLCSSCCGPVAPQCLHRAGLLSQVAAWRAASSRGTHCLQPSLGHCLPACHLNEPSLRSALLIDNAGPSLARLAGRAAPPTPLPTPSSVPCRRRIRICLLASWSGRPLCNLRSGRELSGAFTRLWRSRQGGVCTSVCSRMGSGQALSRRNLHTVVAALRQEDGVCRRSRGGGSGGTLSRPSHIGRSDTVWSCRATRGRTLAPPSIPRNSSGPQVPSSGDPSSPGISHTSRYACCRAARSSWHAFPPSEVPRLSCRGSLRHCLPQRGPLQYPEASSSNSISARLSAASTV